MKQGFYDGISNDDYHGGPGISSTKLKTFYKSPLEFKHYFIDGNFKVTPALKFGTKFHEMILEPKEFEANYYMEHDLPKMDRRTKAGKLLFAEHAEQNKGKEICTIAEFEKLSIMKRNIFEDPTSAKLLMGSDYEKTGYWYEGETLCKLKADIITSNGIIADLKTCQDSMWDAFSLSIYKFGYYISAAWYCMGYEAITGKAPLGFVFIACQSVPPYHVYAYQLDEQDIEYGKEICRRVLGTYTECIKIEKYTKPTQPTIITMPTWAANRLQQEEMLNEQEEMLNG